MRIAASTSPRFVPASAMVVLLDTLAETGGDVRSVLKRSGLGLLERAAREGRATLIPRAAFAQLASDCVLALHDESCRKNRLIPFPVRNHRILLMAMLGCSTLREAVGIMTDFYAMLGERAAQWAVTIDGNVVNFALDRRTREKSVAEFLISLFSLASYHRILGWVIGEEVPLIDVTLAFPDMLDETGLQDLFSINPRCAQPKDSFSFAEHYLDWPIARKPSEIDGLFALFPFDLLPPDYGTETLSQRLVSAMRASLSMGEGIPEIQTMARMFGLTPATLRRRLAREGASLVALRTHCRRDLAMTMLAGTNLTVREIASRLQYADVATFRRAFLGWTKMAPSAWRARSS
ncbi:AraC family transcriptional regulator ligand-binding domain-containing protein [Sphingomonas sp. C3-2]|uniref:AraC family transcriptional regulator ligand-binding domain-containing protein n=1 Tax=Sphingomonas sp. C3-2 TaxID=3062169 RepID=UPI00294ADC01|nr:AraC family transcriptional regulator ligand-binding domain-containing protein [Sphingomonas sp. C3-2]WOK35452.1 AraC family transcriptional regulator ligand-binding domain-containing protein [Sphingomonas sp. C3-2]